MSHATVSSANGDNNSGPVVTSPSPGINFTGGFWSFCTDCWGLEGNHRKNQEKHMKICRLCLEDGATKRNCCNALYCDHCYVKNEKCPNCGVLTKQERLTGVVYQLKVVSENEECRVCLEPGLKRPCCGNYYCDKCYYMTSTCRSCETPVGNL